jgi:DNA-binding transcriptional LysR family regulator
MSYLDNIRTFVRVYELGSMSAAARDQRVSPAVASARISQLEEHLGVRLFQRTTRRLSPTEQGRAFYDGALAVIAAIDEAEASVASLTGEPRGSLFVAAPLGLGRRLVAPAAREFAAAHPEIALRLRLSDRQVNVAEEGLDAAFILGRPEDSSLRIRKVAECARVLVASPGYVERRGLPERGCDLEDGRHDCLMLRFPGAAEFRWDLRGPDGPRRHRVSGRLESDDGDVLTDWALAGAGIAMKPVFEVAHHLAAGRLVPVAKATPPEPVQAACLYAHRRHQDPKVRLFMDFVVERMGEAIAAAEAAAPQEPR